MKGIIEKDFAWFDLRFSCGRTAAGLVLVFMWWERCQCYLTESLSLGNDGCIEFRV